MILESKFSVFETEHTQEEIYLALGRVNFKDMLIEDINSKGEIVKTYKIKRTSENQRERR